MSGLKDYVVRIRKKLHLRKTILSLMTYQPSRKQMEVNQDIVNGAKLNDLSQRLKLDELVILKSGNKTTYSYVDSVDTDGYVFKTISELTKDKNPPANVIDTFELTSGDIDNFISSKRIQTTLGRYLVNQIVLVDVFGEAVPYVNKQIQAKDLNKLLVEGFINKQFKPDQFKQYVDRVFYMEQFSDICVPTETERSMTTDPNIEKLKKALLEKYKGKLDDPVAIANFEKELIAIDKNYLKGDESMRFFKASGDKSFEVSRKKMLLTVGGIDSFSEKIGGVQFVQNSLSEGYDVSTIHTLANEIRKGSYSRGAETQKGGVEAKLLLRIFQDLLIVEDDCKSKVGYPVTIDPDLLKDYIGRYQFTEKGLVVLNEEKLNSLKGKTIEIRSPMTCKTKNGLCKVCVGDALAKLDHDSIVAMILAVSAKLLNMFLKQMHQTSIKTGTITDVTEYMQEN